MISKEEKEYRLALGQSLRRRREMMGLSMSDVNTALGINKGALHGYEKGTRKVPLEKVYELAELYLARPSDIFQGAYDRMHYGYTLDWNDFLKLEFDDNHNEIIISSKMNKKQANIHLSPQNIHFIESTFKL
ncbi:TPA: helix-turn-helix transcriptional regulator [Staphylococcus aureus]|uniref:helix-turn-helix domain-containing protein n=1 Tax=Staphylococcus aureus TaxID=1280 RepID=UPI0015F0FC3F|nr:helix-turn-helix transcriptional regulator [Staphylococcus aureus]MCS5330129.1 helix-turn-helix transcriptional regulator [Staphylococcus aureus]WPG01212.1 helix-turn-helix transcriptional regulator [Staphylococcus aureus]HBC4010355.1 helix-turn-helix transcriptional regulator [Staphylococcus aureus]HDL0591140.1 helix-turn-helix transcriptional regulator [Staphylococcus aureus]HDN3463034.1 helix-turn-helix transcriptional regulator [Staphylococcus aureus]